MRKILAISVLLVFSAYAAAVDNMGNSQLTLWDYAQLKHVKQSIDSEMYSRAYKRLISRADDLLDAPSVSVVMKKHTPASGDKHDYQSIARYYWPNPDTPDGFPYINKDGQSNPAVDEYDRNRLSEMARTVIVQTLAYYLSGDEKYAAKATEQLRVWFLNANTKMNPNLNYSQMIPGRDGGAGRCVLDGYSFVEIIDAIPLLEESKSFTAEDSAGMKAWYTDFLYWMLNSVRGHVEAKKVNNHVVMYDAQIIAYANYVGDTVTRDAYIADFFNKRIDPQIQDDGKQPHELRRTLAYHYSRYNLTHMIDIFQIARNAGIEVGGNSAESFKKVAKALDFLAQYLGKEVGAWPYQQISGWDDVQKELARDLYRAWLLFPEYARWKDLYELYGAHSDSNGRFIILYLKDDSATGVSSINP